MITGKNIENMLEDAWEIFKENFDNLIIKCSQGYCNKNLQKIGIDNVKKNLKNSHWLCWNESDMMMQLSRFFYSQRETRSVSDKEYLDIELHLDKNLNYSNFNDYDFSKKLKYDLKKELNKFSDSRKFPKLDLIISYEESLGPFLLCAEAKYFHSSIWYGSVDTAIEKDIITLAAIKNLEITQEIAYIILDDYFYLHESRNLEELARDYSKKYNVDKELKIFYHDSKKKLISI